MADTDGDKTEAPTPRRRQEARDQGQIARSPDLTASVLLLATLLLLNSTGTRIVGTLKTFVARMLSAASLSDLNAQTAGQDLGQGIKEAGIAMAPMLTGIVIVAILANIAQVGFVLNPARLAPNFEALNPVRGAGKIFGGGFKPAQILINIA